MYDCAYVRHTGRIDLWVLATLKELHRNETRTVYEFPTFPYDKTTAVNFMGRIDMFVDCFCRKKLKKYVNKVITYDGYSCIYGIPTIKAINGICVDEISTLSTRSEKDEISLLAVAAFHDYHGYDRIINAMGIYYKQGGTRNIVLHLVGTGNIVESYKNIVAKYKLENRVIFHGSKFGNELERIYEQADIGLGVFGLYLIGADISSALKVREYLAKGLPVISGCKEDAFENENKYFYLEFANNDSLIDMRDIIQFFDNIYSNRNRKEIHDEIRQYAKSKVDWSSTLMPIIGYFKETEK